MQLHCIVCGQSVSSQVPDDTIIRAYLQCPECLAEMDEEIADAFFTEAARVGQKRARQRAKEYASKSKQKG